jgi:long-chain fatty acid transport protein
MDKFIRRFGALASVVLSATVFPANAAFFQLAENSPAGLGNAFAGGAAIAEDASTVWYNPAGLTRLSGQQVVAGGHYIDPSTKFSKTSANRAALLGGGAVSGGDGGEAGVTALVPNLYYSQTINDRLSFGLGVNVPFGLATDYDDGWVGRYHTLHSEIKTININPALGYKASDELSFGAGLNYQKIEANLTQAVDFGSICALGGVGACTAPGANDGKAEVTAEDDAWGYNLGFLWQPAKSTRVGLAYRSKVKYMIKGDFTVTAPSATAAAVGVAVAKLVNSGARAGITVPDSFSVSIFHQLDSAWAVMGDLTRTRWSRLPELRISFDGTPTQSDSVTTLNLEDSNRYSFGVNYMPGGPWTYRAGVALDQTPTPSETFRTPRMPDENRTWLAVGAGYKSSDKFGVDFAYTHLKLDNAKINKSAGTLGNENFLRGSLVGDYKTSINILSAQANWAF